MAGYKDYGVTKSPDDTDTSPLKSWVRALEKTASIARDGGKTFPLLVEGLSDRFGDSPALFSEHDQLSFRELEARANQYARWALRQRLSRGDVVCLIMQNCPEYMAIWLGVTRVGGIVALINNNLAGESLAHSITIVSPKHVIVASGMELAVAEIGSRLGPDVRCWSHGDGQCSFPRLEDEVRTCAPTRLDPFECAAPSLADKALYIYTSGTTGLPKAANVSHNRLMQWTHWFAGMMDTRPSDRMYNCLPMYHSIGGVVATGATLVNGGSVVLRERFSVSRFWDDVVEWECTLFQYIGELCRYLVNAPPHPKESQHKIRLCCGNGLRPDVWEAFKSRFRIPRILEFYAATEGSFSLYNCEGEPGAIGRIPSFLAHRFPVALVRVGAESGEPERNEQGLCVRCAVNEVGEAIGKIAEDGAAGRFEGYTDQAASDRKILRDAFVKGDAWFRTGDLMRRDARGFFYFVDRIGDTFRWKGENVSTAEVAETITGCPGVKEAVVYGVAVDGMEGRAGMAALVVGDDFDLVAFRNFLAARLPDYARPVFLRLSTEIQTTTTFKPKKRDLMREGYDAVAATDPIYVDDRAREAYIALDAAVLARIRSGAMRL